MHTGQSTLKVPRPPRTPIWEDLKPFGELSWAWSPLRARKADDFAPTARDGCITVGGVDLSSLLLADGQVEAALSSPPVAGIVCAGLVGLREG